MNLALDVAQASEKKLSPAFCRATLLQALAVGLSAHGAVPVYGLFKDAPQSDIHGNTFYYGQVPGVGPK